MSCCNCKLFDEACLKKAASIPLQTQWETIEDSYMQVYYELESKIGRECLETLCNEKETYADAINELLPWFGNNLSSTFKLSKRDTNYVMSSSKVPDADDSNTSAVIQSMRYTSELLWNRFLTWLSKNRDNFPNCYSDPNNNCRVERYFSPFYGGRNWRVR